jgi:hypothetical protein
MFYGFGLYVSFALLLVFKGNILIDSIAITTDLFLWEYIDRDPNLPDN